jgi:hypothetical protein
MSQFETSAGIDSLTGKLNSKERIVMRQKKYRLPSGRIIKLGPKEAYVKERRDYKRSPLTEKEKAQKALWTEVCREGSRIVHDENHPRYSELYDRWIAQATGKSDPVTGKRCIARFINFVCAILLREKQSG